MESPTNRGRIVLLIGSMSLIGFRAVQGRAMV